MIKPSIFLSYKRPSSFIEDKVYNALIRTKNLTVWLDTAELQQNMDMNLEIEKAIKKTNIAVFYLTPEALNSKWVKREHKLALEEKNYLIYYFIDNETTRPLLWEELTLRPIRIPVLNESNFIELILEFVGNLQSRFIEAYYPNVNPISVMEACNAKGINSFQVGRFTKEDDIRVADLIKESTHIRMMVFNASNFFAIFRTEFIQFFKKENVILQLLLANEESEFYDENSTLVHEKFKGDQTNKDLVPFAIKRAQALWEDAGKINQLQIRKFNTQFRLPIIIFDDKVVHLTINLPPSESIEGMTMEIRNTSDESYIHSCIKHFTAVWDKSNPIQ